MDTVTYKHTLYFNVSEADSIRNNLRVYGWAIVRGVVSIEMCAEIARNTADLFTKLKPNWKTEGLPGSLGSGILNYGHVAVQEPFWRVREQYAAFMAKLMGWKKVCTSVDNLKVAVAGRKPPKQSSLKPHVDMSFGSHEHELYLSKEHVTIQAQVCITNPGKFKFCFGDLIDVDDLPYNDKKGFTPIPGAVCPNYIILKPGDTLLWNSNLVHTNDPNLEAYNPDDHECGLRTLGVFVCCANGEWQTDKERAAKIARVKEGLTGTHNPVGIKPNGGHLHMSVSRNPAQKNYIEKPLNPPTLKREWVNIL